MMQLNRNLKRARAKGLTVIVAQPNELQIDIDKSKALELYGWQMYMLREAKLTKGWRVRILPSKSRGHAHILVTMPRKMRLIERILLQTLLGSDIKREMFNYLRAKRGSKLPIVLFRRPSHVQS
jgi:hypothetical protein